MSAPTMASRKPPRGQAQPRPTAPVEAGPSRPFIAALANAGRRTLAMLRLWQERADERRRLAEMPDYLLKDMGLSRVQAREEAAKPFWRP